MSLALHVFDTLDAVSPAEWNRLARGNPTLAYEFLDTLHRSGCASEATGWKPQYLVLRDGEELAGAVPLYLKAHSYGEYVFDWAWAEAHERHGIAYYPKFLAAVPFTPATGARVLARDAEARRMLAAALPELARKAGVSSLHVLFPDEEDASALRETGMLERTGV